MNREANAEAQRHKAALERISADGTKYNDMPEIAKEALKPSPPATLQEQAREAFVVWEITGNHFMLIDFARRVAKGEAA